LSVKGSPVGVALAFPAALVAVGASAGDVVAVAEDALVAVAPVGVELPLDGGCVVVADGLAEDVVAVEASLPPHAASNAATSAQASKTAGARKIGRTGRWMGG
jgi:hypothetical protein